MPDPNAGVIQILQRTEPWVRLASVVAFLLAGLMMAFAAEAILGGSSPRRFETLPFLLLYLVAGVVFLVPAFHLHKYAGRIRAFVAQGHQVHLEAALEAQRKFWAFTGVLALLAFMGLAFAAVLAVI
ncbi:MAG TPA: hypothetical protein VGZ27_11575 [Vicinamibacterales bacterium]|nr:hypothetical protein [Vicinamibacterales bacterium]